MVDYHADPRKRITISEALKSPWFDEVRNEECEIRSEQKMIFPFERELAECEGNEKKRIRQMIFKEALIYA